MHNWTTFFVTSQIWTATFLITEDRLAAILAGFFLVLAVILLYMSDEE